MENQENLVQYFKIIFLFFVNIMLGVILNKTYFDSFVFSYLYIKIGNK